MDHGVPESSVTPVAAASMIQQGSVRTGPRGRATEHPGVRRMFSPLPLQACFPPSYAVYISLVFNEIHCIFLGQLLSNFWHILMVFSAAQPDRETPGIDKHSLCFDVQTAFFHEALLCLSCEILTPSSHTVQNPQQSGDMAGRIRDPWHWWDRAFRATQSSKMERSCRETTDAWQPSIAGQDEWTAQHPPGFYGDFLTSGHLHHILSPHKQHLKLCCWQIEKFPSAGCLKTIAEYNKGPLDMWDPSLGVFQPQWVEPWLWHTSYEICQRTSCMSASLSAKGRDSNLPTSGVAVRMREWDVSLHVKCSAW